MRRLRPVWPLMLALAIASCGGGSNSPPPQEATPLPSQTVQPEATPSVTVGGPLQLVLPEQVNASLGEPILAPPDAPALPNFQFENGIRVAALGPLVAWRKDAILVTTIPSAQTIRDPNSGEPIGSVELPHTIVSWNPFTSERRVLWETEQGTQDVVAAVEGDWAIVVRIGFQLPFKEWTLSLRNLSTGEVRLIAESDPSVLDDQGLPVGLPLGVAPYPALHGGTAAWVEWVRDGGEVRKRLMLYHLASGEKEMLLQVDDPRREDVRWPSLGGRRIAWIHDRHDWPDSQIVVRSLATGEEKRFIPGRTPFDGKLSADGRYFAWDLEFAHKYALEIDTAEVVKFAEDEGDQIAIGGNVASWLPNKKAGYYDLDKREVRFTANAGGGAAGVLGQGWFYYRILAVENGREIEEKTSYRFVRID